MKKILLGTSALVLLAGAAAAQQVTTKAPFTVTLGGSIRSDFIIVNDNAANASSREARLDYRLHLKAEAKAENGLTYGFDARLRNNQNGSGQANQDVVGADRKFVYMGGSWGKIELGDTLAPDSNFEVQAPSVGIGQADYAFGPSTGNYSYYHFNEGTFDTKVVYYTPVFSGFQAGISYTPEKGSRGRDNARSKFVTGSSNNYNDLIALGAAYTGKFGDVGVKLGGGVEFGDEKDVSSTVKATVGDYTVWHLGAQVSYAGFTFGGHYFDNGESGLAKGDDQIGWQLGLTYSTGPWGVGINYARVDTDYAARGRRDDTDYMVGLGAAYQLAPGLSLQADIVKFEAESQTTGLKAGNTKNDGTLFTFRTRVDF
ncbi:porin [Elstera cyanobacteriorum]|uniref:porin n=1 Tax=Elstera cyanobacteriorum TaxID=2022747 RepID=UPI002354D8F4|nr:porin [Elstera cyanobacteriorum]MCK6441424.1 porin [Elstera cyanobacteriorum]